MGRAVPSASRVTALAASAPTVDCRSPSTAEALPTRSPREPIAAAVAFGRTSPLDETPATIAAARTTGPASARAATTSTRYESTPATTPTRSASRTPILARSQRFACEAAMTPSAFAPVTSPSHSGLIPESSTKTNGAPAMPANMAASLAPPASESRRNRRSRSAEPDRSVSRSPPGMVACGGRLSGSESATRHRRTNPTAASTTKRVRQPAVAARRPPANGARTGAAPMTRKRHEYSVAASRSEQRSRTTARETTITAQAPSPCANRAARSAGRLHAAAPDADAAAYSASPASSGGRRPRRSDSGPWTSCPAATPAR